MDRTYAQKPGFSTGIGDEPQGCAQKPDFAPTLRQFGNEYSIFWLSKGQKMGRRGETPKGEKLTPRLPHQCRNRYENES
jgi:hypothetical protein